MAKFLLCFLLLPFALSAQISWEEKNVFPGGVRSSGVSFVIGNNAYVGLGSDDTGYRLDFWKYTPASDTWQEVAAFPGEGRTDAVAFSVGGKGYVATGRGNAGDLADVWEYDPVADQWIQKTTFGGGSRQSAVAFAIGNRVFITTGKTDGTYFADCWEYFPATDQWVARANLPSGQRRSEAFAFALSGLGYVGGGFWFTGSSTQIQNNLYAYDPVADVWSEKVFAHIGLSGQNSVAWVMDGRAFFGLGRGDNDVYEYHPQDSRIASETAFGPDTQDNRSDAVAFVMDELAYVGLGAYWPTISSEQVQNDIWQAVLRQPQGPSNVQLVSLTSYEVEISWEDDANDIQGYQIEIAEQIEGAFTPYADKSTYPAQRSNSLSKRFYDWNEGDVFFVRVRSLSDGLISEPIEVIPPLLEPENFSAIPEGNTRVALQWENVSAKANTLIIERSVGRKDNFVTLATLDASLTGYTDTELTPNTTYWYRITAKNATNASGATPSRRATPSEGLGYWTKESDLSLSVPYGALSEVVQQKVYFGIGGSNSDWYSYDLVTRAYEQKAAFPQLQSDLSIHSFTAAGYIYVVYNYSAFSNDLWRYDPERDRWEQMQDAPQGIDAAVGYAGKGYAIGNFSNFYSYDPTEDTWTQKAGGPSTIFYDIKAFVVDNNVYFGMGRDNKGAINELWQYDISTDVWHRRADFPGSTVRKNNIFTIGKKVYLVGGLGTGFNHYMREGWAYDSATDTWKNIAALPSRGYALRRGFSFGGKGYVLGGSGIDDKVSWVYHPNGLNAPSHLQYTAYYGEEMSIQLTWQDNTAQETSQIIERKTGDGAYEKLAVLPANQTSYTDAGLQSGDDYTYRITAMNATHQGVSPPLTATLPVQATDVQLRGRTLHYEDYAITEVKCYWYHSADPQNFMVELAEGADVSNEDFRIVDTVSYKFAPETGDAYYYEYSLRPAPEGQFVWARVTTLGDLFNAPPSEPVRLLVPYHAPQSLVGQYQPKNYAVQLTWKDEWDTEAFLILQRALPGSEVYSTVDTLSANTTTYADRLPNLTGGEYRYRLAAGNQLSTEWSWSYPVKVVVDQSVIVSGIDEAEPSDVIVYPLPFTTHIRLRGSDLAQFKRVDLLSGQGRMLRSFELQPTHPSLNVSSYPPGTYFLRLIGAEKSTVRKVIKY